MKPDRIPLNPAQALTLLLLVATACSPAAATTPVATEVVAPPPSAEIVLELAGPSGTKSFTMEELQALPVTEGQGGFVSSTGKITIPAAFKGVALKDLAAVLGILALVFVATSAIGFCPLYVPLKISTTKKQ